MEMVYVYHGDTNERQGSELHMVKKEEGTEKQQLSGPEPATSRSIGSKGQPKIWRSLALVRLAVVFSFSPLSLPRVVRYLVLH